jgi:hypothetical protein
MQTPPARCRQPDTFPEFAAGAALACGVCLTICLGTLLVGCSRDARAVRLPALQANDELYRVTCGGAIELCRQEALEACHGDYEVLESTGAPVEPARITTAPGPSSTGPRYQRKGWQGSIVVACRTAATDAPRLAQPRSAAQPAHEERSAPELGPGQMCVPGTTQECLGPAACRGAQACLADARGYGACDCGSAGGSTPAAPGETPPGSGPSDASQQQP